MRNASSDGKLAIYKSQATSISKKKATKSDEMRKCELEKTALEKTLREKESQYRRRAGSST